MKSIFRHIASRLAALCLVLAAATTISGCDTIKEDNSNCPEGLYLRFFYTYHMGSDGCRLAQQVSTLDIFIYNAGDGSLADHKRIPVSSLDENHGTKLMLPKGDYRIVTWGNYDEQDHLIAVHDNYAQMQLRLKTQSGDFGSTASLFHADTPVAVGSLRQTDADVYMTKNTNKIRIIIQDPDGQPIDPSLFTITMTGVNGIYNCDNTLAAESQYLPLNYIPTYTYDEDDLWMQADFNIYRLFSNECDGVRLRIAANTHPNTPLYNLWLSREILGAIAYICTDQDLDWEDEYTLVYTVREEMGNWALVSIFINGWEIVIQNSGI